MDDSRRPVRLGRRRLLQGPPCGARVLRRGRGESLAARLRRPHSREHRRGPVPDGDRHLRLRQADLRESRVGEAGGQLHDCARLQVHHEAGRLRDADSPRDGVGTRWRLDRQRCVRVQPVQPELEDGSLRRGQQQDRRLRLALHGRQREDHPRGHRHRPRPGLRLFPRGMRNLRQDRRLLRRRRKHRLLAHGARKLHDHRRRREPASRNRRAVRREAHVLRLVLRREQDQGQGLRLRDGLARHDEG